MYPHIQGEKSLTFVIDDQSHSITSDHTNYERVLKRVRNKPVTEKNTSKILELAKPIQQFNRIFAQGSSGFSIIDGVLTCVIDSQEFPLSTSLYKEILNIHNSNGNLEPLYNFVVKLAKNPRKEVIDELWGFISSCGLAITESGNFLAYKNVNNDFMDVYTGTMDNSPGKTLFMPRWAVEHDPNRTCAAGLHFAAWGYLGSYASGRKTVILSISPENVVSIPTDYNNMKGRACEYTVLREVEQPEELKYHSVYSDEGVASQSFEDDYWSDDFTEYGPYEADDQLVEVLYSNDETATGTVNAFNWGYRCDDYDIVGYRVYRRDDYDIVGYRVVE